MKYIFYLGHPAHFHLFKLVIQRLKHNGHDVLITTKKKDILDDLLISQGWEYHNLLPKGRKDNKFSIFLGLLKRDFALLKIVKRFSPDLMVGTSVEIAHVGKVKSIPSLIVNEDDNDVVPLFSKLAYPFATNIVSPECCRVGRWYNKAIYYQGYHELSYLHPNHFKNNRNLIINLFNNCRKFFILRFAKLGAHHDTGKTGITTQIAQNIINLLKPNGNIYISAERTLEEQFEQYKIKINPIDMHHALYYADLYIGDSQTMAAEAASLGTPSVRFNDFVGKLGYLEELEHKYGLTYGIKTNEPEKLYQKVEELLSIPNLKEEWHRRRVKMLADKIDVTAFMVWFVENYPESIRIMKENPDYQYRFK